MTATSKLIAYCAFHDGEPDIPVEIVFIYKFIQNGAGATKLVSVIEFVDSLAMMKYAERLA